MGEAERLLEGPRLATLLCRLQKGRERWQSLTARGLCHVHIRCMWLQVPKPAFEIEEEETHSSHSGDPGFPPGACMLKREGRLPQQSPGREGRMLV